MATTYRSLPLSKIYLDPENPRHHPIENEREIIAHLLETEDVRPLARSVAQLGSLSPIEVLAVAPHPTAKGAYVAAEGNRRVCALKLLADPDKAPNDKENRYFRGLQKVMAKPIQTVQVAVFHNLDAARPWVSLRHEGEQGGIGTKAWRAEQSTRFAMKGDGKSPNTQALLLLNYARNKQLLSSDELDSISITTITRYLSNPVLRSAFGLIDNKSLWISVPADQFSTAVTRFLRDAALGERVSSRSIAADRKKYGEELLSDGTSPATRGVEAHDALGETYKAASIKQDEPQPVTKKVTKNFRLRDDDLHVVPAGYSHRVADPVFQRLFKELKSLKAEEFAFASTYLFRAVIEQAAILFLKTYGIAPAAELHRKLENVAIKLEEDGYSGRGQQALRKMSSDIDSRYSPDTIGMFIHGSAVPNRNLVIKAWDNFEPTMNKILDRINAPD